MRANTIGKLGIGITSVLFISSLMTTNAMFTSAQATLKLNLLAGPLFGIFGALGFLTFGFIAKKVRNRFVHGHSLNTLLRTRIKEQRAKVVFIIIGITYVLDFLLLAIGASVILYAGFRIPTALGVIFFISLGLPLALFRSIRYIGNYNIYKIGLFFSIVIIMLVYLFITVDLEQMYFGMKLYHPYLFAIQPKELFLFSLSVFLIFSGKVLSDIGAWNLIFRIKKGKIQQSFLLTGLIWATIPLAFSIMIYPALSQGGFLNFHTIFYDLLSMLKSEFLVVSATTILLVTLVSTYYTRLHEFLRFFEIEFNYNKKPTKLILTFGIFTLLFVSYLFFQPSILELFYFIGVLHTSLLVPLLIILFIDKQELRNAAPYIIILSALIGYIVRIMSTEYASILISFFTPILLFSLLYICLKIKPKTIV